MNIIDKIVVITGASKGIGKSTALLMSEKGAKLAVSARNKKLLKELEQQISTEIITFAGDMSNEQDINAFIEKTISHYGKLDILINNAGMGIFKPVIDLTTDEWDEMFNLNMRGLFLITRAAIPYLRQAGESVIVNVASLAGKNAIANGAGYAATKHAVLGFGRSLMLEERKNGIRVLNICPGSVNTPFNPGRLQNDPHRSRNILQPDDVARSIIHMVEQPQNAMVSEIDIRPSNP